MRIRHEKSRRVPSVSLSRESNGPGECVCMNPIPDSAFLIRKCLICKGLTHQKFGIWNRESIGRDAGAERALLRVVSRDY